MKNHSIYFILALATFFSCSDSEYKIIVPDGYVGEVCLIKSNVSTICFLGTRWSWIRDKA